MTVNYSHIIKDLVRNHRKTAGLSQEELAKVAGVGKTIIFDIEHGKETVRLITLEKVLEALNIKITFDSPIIRKDRANEKG